MILRAAVLRNQIHVKVIMFSVPSHFYIDIFHFKRTENWTWRVESALEVMLPNILMVWLTKRCDVLGPRPPSVMKQVETPK